MIEIRLERQKDIAAIKGVHDRAFGQTQESDLVAALRKNCRDFLSLVAVENGTIVGHILFTPAVIETGRRPIDGMGLAPMAVLPAYQNRGIGSRLVERGIRILKRRRTPFVLVLGHPDYYPRFGFEKASRYGISSQWPGVPEEAFMILFLDPKDGKNVSGIGRYRKEFDAAV